jgi:hypothetical protein
MLDPQPDSAEAQKAEAAARLAGWAALLHFNRVESFDPDAVVMSDQLVALMDRVAMTGVPVVTVSMGTPYALSRMRDTSAQICSYSTSDASLRATLRVLKGEVSAPGVLPVELKPVALTT